MKFKFLLLLFLGYINSRAQNDNLMGIQWYLYEIEIDDMVALVPESVPGIDYLTIFSDESFMTNSCHGFEGQFTDLTDNSFNLMNISVTMMECEYDDYDFFDNFYFSIFNGYENEVFNYEIDSNTDFPNAQILTITNLHGSKARYHNAILSNNEVITNHIKFYPNPVQDKFNIQNPDLEIVTIKISDVNGQLVFQQKVNSDKFEIDFSKYAKGIYFITVESHNKIIQTEKVIKK